jgi:acetyltransferase-like isoleucine patch superfamily enzyme
VYVDYEVSIGKNCKIQNNVSVYHGVSLGDGVFLGPHVCFTNDRIPRAVNPDGSPKSHSDWTITPIQVLEGAAIGAHSVILPGIQLGSFSMVGSGSVVTRDVPDQALVVGNPARFHSWVCKCGNKVEKQYQSCTACEDKSKKSHE